MSILPAIPVLLLGLVTVWFLWPIIVDPLRRRDEPSNMTDEDDGLAELYFERWSKTNTLSQVERW